MINDIKELMNNEVNVTKELIDTHKCRIMGTINTYNITLQKHNFKYAKAIVNKGAIASSVFPIDKEGNVYLETQYRFNLRRALIELPAGRAEENESFLDCATRELKEETALISDNIIDDYEYYVQLDFTDEKLGTFLATDVVFEGEQNLDNDELVNVLKMPMDVCEELIRRNIIEDERTIISFGLAKLFHNIKINETVNKEESVKKVIERLELDNEKLKEEEVDISYTYACEFGFVQDHIVKTSNLVNTRRECMYMQPGKIVIPISKGGKIGLKVKHMPVIDSNAIQLPVYEEFDKDLEFENFGKLLTTVGYTNDVQELYLLKNLEENDKYIWVDIDVIKELIKNKMIVDGKVLAALLKFLI